MDSSFSRYSCRHSEPRCGILYWRGMWADTSWSRAGWASTRRRSTADMQERHDDAEWLAAPIGNAASLIGKKAMSSKCYRVLPSQELPAAILLNGRPTLSSSLLLFFVLPMPFVRHASCFRGSCSADTKPEQTRPSQRYLPIKQSTISLDPPAVALHQYR